MTHHHHCQNVITRRFLIHSFWASLILLAFSCSDTSTSDQNGRDARLDNGSHVGGDNTMSGDFQIVRDGESGNADGTSSDSGGSSIEPRYAETEKAIASAVTAFNQAIASGTVEDGFAAAAAAMKASSEVAQVDYSVDKDGNIQFLAVF